MIRKLPPGTVHIWFAWMTTPPWSAQTLCGVLSDEEHCVASQYAFVRDQQAFVLRRGLLRMLLAQYVGKPPTTLQLIAGPQGKPELLPEAEQPALHFNLSHSGNLTLYAIAGQPIGVDVEQVTTEQDVAAMAQYFFSPPERAWLATLPQDQQTRGALRLWTCKEACVKATGDGITAAFEQVCVALNSGTAQLLDTAGDAQIAKRWSLREFIPVPGYVAALATSQDYTEVALSVRSLVPTFVAPCWRSEMSLLF